MRGTTTTGKGARGCTACPRGTELFNITQGNLVAPSCRPCAADTFQPSVVLLSDNPECLPCAEGFRTAGASTPGNRSRCARCKPGRAGAKCLQCGKNSWAAGWAASNNKNLQCRPCSEGTEAPAGSTSKAACQAVTSSSPNPDSSPDPSPSPTPSPSPSSSPSVKPSPSPSPAPPATQSPSPSPSLNPDPSPSPSPSPQPSPSPRPSPDNGDRPKPYIHLSVSTLSARGVLAGDNVAQWPNIGSAADKVPQATAGDTGIPVLRKTACGAPCVSLGAIDGIDNAGYFSFGSVDWHGASAANPGFAFVALTSYTSAVNTYNKQYGGWLTTPIPTSPADYKTPYSYIGKATWGDAELANIDLREMKWWDEALTTAQLQAEIAALKAAYPGPCYGYDCGPHGGCFEDPANGCAAACACSEGYYGTKCETGRSNSPWRRLLRW
uniref:EGF-like domain-containing protein n=1 Tax=Tetradesmus obliquus TaxID=3088 RepID=A0A383V807_TETOB|eukprot:jgi/Sobl393_1/9723/SZX61093.1